MKHPSTKRLLSVVAVACASLSIAAACGKSKGNSPVTESPTPTPVAPTNVAATAGNHTLHVTWDGVTNATGYRVYVSPAAFTTTAGLTGTFVIGSPWDASGVPNWTTLHVRVTALQDAAQSELSDEATAMPNAGYVLTSRSDAGNKAVNWHHADETDVVTDSIANAELIPTALVGTSAQLYGIGTAGAYTEVGIARASGHTTLAPAMSGFTYRFLGFAANHAILEAAHAGVYDVYSYALDGSASNLLHQGCTAAVAPARIANDTGFLFQCVSGGSTLHVWSNGVSGSTALNSTSSTLSGIGLTATRAYFSDSVGGRVFTCLLNSTDTPVDLIGAANAGTVSLLAIGSQHLIVQRNVNGGGNYVVNMHDFDGTLVAIVYASSTTSWTIDNATGIAADGKTFLTHGSDGSANLVVDQGMTVAVSSIRGGATGTVTTTQFIPPGDRVLNFMTGGPWRIVTLANPTTAIDVPNSGTYQLRGIQAGWVLLYDSANAALKAYSTTNTDSHTLSTSYNGLGIVYEPDLSVFWVENDFTTHTATADGAVAATQIDTGANQVSQGSLSSDGRHWFVSQRYPTTTDYDTMFWTATATSAQTIAGSASTEQGIFLP